MRGGIKQSLVVSPAAKYFNNVSLTQTRIHVAVGSVSFTTHFSISSATPDVVTVNALDRAGRPASNCSGKIDKGAWS